MIKIELHINIEQEVEQITQTPSKHQNSPIKQPLNDSSPKTKSIVERLHEKMLDALPSQNEKEITKQVIKQAIHKGALWHSRGKYTKRLRRLKTSLKVGDTLHFYYDESVLSQVTPQAELLADYTDYSVWYKPYGMLSQGSKWSDHCTITRFAQQYFSNERSCFIVHRLDRAATGVIIVAHTKKATQALTAMFEAHTFDKRYQIIVQGDFSTLPSPYVIDSDVDNKKSKSIFNLHTVNAKSNESLIDVQIETGRKHQIRKHAASIGMPVVGDRLYGLKEATTEKDLQLCAVSLSFECPLTNTLKDIQLPEHLRLTL